MMAAQRGWSVEETASKFMELSIELRSVPGIITGFTRTSLHRMPSQGQRAADRRTRDENETVDPTLTAILGYTSITVL